MSSTMLKLNRHSHDRHLDGLPAGPATGPADKVAQSLQRWLVCLGSTPTTRQPAASALYSRKPRNCANDQECSRRREARPHCVTRPRMSVRFSTMTVVPGVTDCTMRLDRT